MLANNGEKYEIVSVRKVSTLKTAEDSYFLYYETVNHQPGYGEKFP